MTQKEKIINLLSDGEWHNATELHDICWRFGARIFDLKREGYIFNKRKGNNGLEDWQLIVSPEEQGRLFATSALGRVEGDF